VRNRATRFCARGEPRTARLHTLHRWAGVSRTASTLVRGIIAYAVTSGARLTADVPTFGEMGLTAPSYSEWEALRSQGHAKGHDR
jgi:hypothetical protein